MWLFDNPYWWMWLVMIHTGPWNPKSENHWSFLQMVKLREGEGVTCPRSQVLRFVTEPGLGPECPDFQASAFLTGLIRGSSRVLSLSFALSKREIQKDFQLEKKRDRFLTGKKALNVYEIPGNRPPSQPEERSTSWEPPERRYPSSKVRSSGCALLEQLWRDTPRPRSEKPK